ncbi:cyclodeaminase/cyclohydrolase family protein [Microbacterium sp. NPDC091313]
MTDPIDGVTPWLDALAEPVPAPGGGAAAAVVIAVAAATTTMVGGYAPPGERDAAVRAGGGIRAAALSAYARDAAASARVVAAFRGASADLPAALEEATDASLAVAETAAELMPILSALRDRGDPRLRADVSVAAHLAAGAVRAAAATAADNLASWPDAPPQARARLASARLLAAALDALAG